MSWVHVKDPDEVENYTFDYEDYLAGATILTSTWTLATGITEAASSKTASTATVRISSGTTGKKYKVTNRITTSDLRTHEESFDLRVENR